MTFLEGKGWEDAKDKIRKVRYLHIRDARKAVAEIAWILCAAMVPDARDQLEALYPGSIGQHGRSFMVTEGYFAVD